MLRTDSFEFVALDGTVVRRPIERPSVGRGEVLVEVEAAALGSYRPVPGPRAVALGDGFVGRIVELGEGVPVERLGQRVAGVVRVGSAASHVAVPADGATPVAENASVDRAALTLVTGLTALSIDYSHPVGAGQVFLVLDLTGTACGLVAGLVRRRGAMALAWRVDGTEVDEATRSGFDPVLTGPVPPTPDQLRELTGGRLADLIYDASFTDHSPWARVESLLEPDGLALRWPASTVADWDPARSRPLDTIGEATRHFVRQGVPPVTGMGRALRALARDWDAGELYAPVRLFDVSQIDAALIAVGDAHALGRVVVRVRS